MAAISGPEKMQPCGHRGHQISLREDLRRLPIRTAITANISPACTKNSSSHILRPLGMSQVFPKEPKSSYESGLASPKKSLLRDDDQDQVARKLKTRFGRARIPWGRMPCTYSSIDKIRAELAVNETPDPNKCGCRNLRCCEETGHKPGACAAAFAMQFWTFRWE